MRPNPADDSAPQLYTVHPGAALPGGRIELTGTALGVDADLHPRPSALLNDQPASLALSRANRAVVTVPREAAPGPLQIVRAGHVSNALPVRIAVPLMEGINPVANPVIDADGNLYVMSSGPRGERVDVAIFRIDRGLEVRPFIRDLLNVSSLAFDREGFLYASSRAEGTVYRISPEGSIATYAEGMGIATGLAFDRDGNLFVGDRSGTIFKLVRRPATLSAETANPGLVASETFVFATLEPSVAAYHLAFRDDGTLLVTAPTTSSYSSIHAIAPDGSVSTYFRGLGRPQGMALDVEGNVYVAASFQGHRGIVRIDNQRRPELILSGDDLVGLCFLEDGNAALTTRSALFHVDLGIEGRQLF